MLEFLGSNRDVRCRRGSSPLVSKFKGVGEGATRRGGIFFEEGTHTLLSVGYVVSVAASFNGCGLNNRN